MNEKIGSYHVIDLPPARRDLPALLDLIWWKHFVYGFLEVDVTVVRQFIEDYEARNKEELSFTGYLVFCLAHAIDKDKAVQAYLRGRKQLVVFDDVDVAMTIERRMGGTLAPTAHIIRRANQKTYLEINREIHIARSTPAVTNRGLPPWFRFCLRLPWPLSRLFGVLIKAFNRHDPARFAVAFSGTVGVTAVGMFGKDEGGWGLVPIPHSLGLIVGSIARKPAVVEEQIVPREILNLTVAFDHDVVDGAPAARFGKRLVQMIESGYGLFDEPSIPIAATEPVMAGSE